MKISQPPVSIPRLNSLLHRLQKAPPPKDEETCLDQLMAFLESPPPETRDRWKEGVAMCAGWNITTSSAAVYRLYKSYAIEWRARIALERTGAERQSPRNLRRKIALLTATRMAELLANPDTPPATIAALIRIEQRQRALDLVRERNEDAKRDLNKRALDHLRSSTTFNFPAKFALDELEKALANPPCPFKLFGLKPPIPLSAFSALAMAPTGVAKSPPVPPKKPTPHPSQVAPPA